jgi:hypothetical protein
LGMLLVTTLVSAQTATSKSGSTLSSFGYVDVFCDPHGTALAAYQLELVAEDNCATIVGVEGGNHPAFREAPHYDAAALANHRIILAAFSTQRDLPAARTKIARVHFRFEKPDRRLTPKLLVAGGSDGKTIAVDVSVSEGAAP